MTWITTIWRWLVAEWNSDYCEPALGEPPRWQTQQDTRSRHPHPSPAEQPNAVGLTRSELDEKFAQFLKEYGDDR